MKRKSKDLKPEETVESFVFPVEIPPQQKQAADAELAEIRRNRQSQLSDDETSGSNGTAGPWSDPT